MKRLVDILIGVLVLALIGVGGYFGYTKFIAENDATPSGGKTGPVAAVNGSNIRLPTLTTTQLSSVLPDAVDLPADLSGATAGTPTLINLNTSQETLGLSSGSAATSRFTQIRGSYNWGSALSITFDTCSLNRDTSFITIYASQLTNSATARAFIDDANVRGYYQALYYTLSEASDLHGWYLTANEPITGQCFVNEQQNFLVFDYLGIVVIAQVNTNADANAALGKSTLDALAPRIISRIQSLDALATVTLPPTPESQTADISLLTADTTLDDLNFLLPSTRDWDLSNLYTAVDDESQRFTLVELGDFYRAIGTPALTTLADNIDRAGRRYGLIGLFIRVWEPEIPCVEGDPARIEVNMSLFERPAGADAYMRDQGLQAAWQSTGLFTEFTNKANGVYAYGTTTNDCGNMQIVQKSVYYERLLYTISIMVPLSTDQQTTIADLDAMIEDSLSTLYMQRLR